MTELTDAMRIDKLNKIVEELERRNTNQTVMLKDMATEAVRQDKVIADLKDVDACSCNGWKIATGICLLYELFKFLLS